MRWGLPFIGLNLPVLRGDYRFQSPPRDSSRYGTRRPGTLLCCRHRACSWDQSWIRAGPDQDAIVDWAKRLNHFRGGSARDYLVYGRMLRPWIVNNVTERDFGWGKEPLVQSATWQAQDGRIGVVLANYADLGESLRVALQGQGNKRLVFSMDSETKERNIELPSVIDLESLALSV